MGGAAEEGGGGVVPLSGKAIGNDSTPVGRRGRPAETELSLQLRSFYLHL